MVWGEPTCREDAEIGGELQLSHQQGCTTHTKRLPPSTAAART